MQFQERYDFLKTAIARYDGYYNLAAVKASLLLTSNAVLLAPGLGEQGQFLQIAGSPGASRTLLFAAAALSLASIACAAWVMASTLRRRPGRDEDSLMFSENVAAMDEDAYVAAVARADDAVVLDGLARLAHRLAGGVSRKFRLINLSLAALVAAVLSAFAALMA
jgi:hypothetical protein